jgi:uncharacterized membrane protein
MAALAFNVPMDDTLRIIAIWVHILGIAIFVGPQFFLAFAWVPAARGIADQRVRLELTRKLTRSFGYIGGAGIVLIVLAGSYLISTWRDHWAIPDDVDFTSLRYGVIFIIKMSVLVVMLAVVGAHMFWVGPRLADTMEAHLDGHATEADVRSARMLSMVFSILGLLLALAMMALGVTLSTGSFSLDKA